MKKEAIICDECGKEIGEHDLYWHIDAKRDRPCGALILCDPIEPVEVDYCDDCYKEITPKSMNPYKQ